MRDVVYFFSISRGAMRSAVVQETLYLYLGCQLGMWFFFSISRGAVKSAVVQETLEMGSCGAWCPKGVRVGVGVARGFGGSGFVGAMRRMMEVCMYVLYVCMPDMYVLYVCLICMPYMYALYVCLICMPADDGSVERGQDTQHTHDTERIQRMYALYVCLICMPYMYALYVCHTRHRTHPTH